MKYHLSAAAVDKCRSKCEAENSEQTKPVLLERSIYKQQLKLHVRLSISLPAIQSLYFIG